MGRRCIRTRFTSRLVAFDRAAPPTNHNKTSTSRDQLQQFETILFPQDMILDKYKLHLNIIHKSTGVTWNVGPYELMRLPGHPNLNLT